MDPPPRGGCATGRTHRRRRSSLPSILKQQVERTYREVRRPVDPVADLRERARRWSQNEPGLDLDRDQTRDWAVVIGHLDDLSALHQPQMSGQVVLEVCDSDLFHGHM